MRRAPEVPSGDDEEGIWVGGALGAIFGDERARSCRAELEELSIWRRSSGSMGRICEYGEVYCPLCRSKKVADAGMATVDGSPVHRVECERCAGTFFIPCED